MTAIATQGTGLRHVRKTITFTGGAGAGAVGNVTVFTLTGRVGLQYMSARVTTQLASAGGGSCSLGTPLNATFFCSANTVNGLAVGELDSGFGAGNDAAYSLCAVGQRLAASPIIVVTTAAVTAGVIVFDAWYYPITDDGALAGDDIDVELVDSILDEVVEGSLTLRQLIRLMSSALAGKLSGAATTTVTIRDVSDTKNRIVATVDPDGNRTALTLDSS